MLSRLYDRLSAFTHRHLTFRLVVVLGTLGEIVLWLGFFGQRQRAPVSGYVVYAYVFDLATLALYVVRLVRREESNLRVVLTLLFTVLTLVVSFASFYWNYGTMKHFSQPLSRTDALYFTLGTLSTAGTGTLSATSETSRGLVSLQMGLDLLLLIFSIGMAASRFATMKSAGDNGGSAQASGRDVSKN